MTLPIANFLACLALLVTALSAPNELVGQEEASESLRYQPDTPLAQQILQMSDSTRREVEMLIEQLASESFQAREDATGRLLEIGQPALAQLKLTNSRDLEVRYRAGMIAKKIEDEQFEGLARSFLLDPSPQKSYGFPAWAPFSTLVGHSRTSKLLFLDMIRLHPELVNLIDKLTSTEAPQIADYAQLEHESAKIAARLASNRMNRMEVPEIGDFGALLFAASLMEKSPIEVNELIRDNAYLVPISTYMRRRGYAPSLRRLFGAWIPKSHAAMAFKAINISLQYGLESGVEIARENLAANLDIRTREHAILCLARFGSVADIGRLVALLDDTTVCHEFAGRQSPLAPPDRRIEESNESPPGAQPGDLSILESGSMVRINDLALAAMCMLAEEEPQSLFPGFVPHSVYGFDSRSVAVSRTQRAEAARDELIGQWKSRFTGNSGS